MCVIDPNAETSWQGTENAAESKAQNEARMSRNKAPPDRYAVVGHPIEHSRSPLIHELFARQTGQNLTYERIDAEPGSFETAVRGFGAAGGKGLNVTVPHKEAAFELVDEISAPAHAAGAVNTITIAQGRLRGDNTDGAGFMRDVVVNQRQPVAGRSVLVLGAGGAARGILGPLLAAGPRELVIANRTQERAERLLAGLGAAAGTPRRVALFDELPSLAPFDIVINASSAGLQGEAPPFPKSIVGPNSFCYDLVYSVHDTPFVAWARQAGAAHAVQGWGMLIEQAAESFFIWRGVRPDTAPIRKQLIR
jgi:shikimate dehydrogenase